MIFHDLEGDTVETVVVDNSYGRVLELVVANGSDAVLGYSAWMDRDMARALAADLLAFVDSEPENER